MNDFDYIDMEVELEVEFGMVLRVIWAHIIRQIPVMTLSLTKCS